MGDIFRDVTRVAIQEREDLWILGHVDNRDTATVALHEVFWIPTLFRQPDNGKDPHPVRSAFEANRGVEQEHSGKEVLSSDDTNILVAKGYNIDFVSDLGMLTTASELQSAE